MPETSLEPLITECPSCHTRFRVNEAQLTMAGGRVRCGACLFVFQATDYLVFGSATSQRQNTSPAELDQLLDELARDVPIPAPPQQPSAAPGRVLPGSARSRGTTHSEQMGRSSPSSVPVREPKSRLDSVDAVSDHESDQSAVVPMPVQESAQESPPESVPVRDLNEPVSVPVRDLIRGSVPVRDLNDTDASDQASVEEILMADVPVDEPMAKTTESAPPSVLTAESPADTALRAQSAAEAAATVATSATGEGASDGAAPAAVERRRRRRAESARPPVAAASPAVGGHLSESLVAATPAAAAPRRRRWWLPFAVVVAAAALVAQVLWFQFDVWSRDLQFRPIYERICPYAGCRLPVLRALEAMHSRNLVVRSHPDVAGALLVDALLVNEAPYPQPFPVIELRFSSMEGQLVAGRRFKPSEYLAGELQGAEMIEPMTPVHISLEIEDPGADAVNYVMVFR